ncbi:MAG TPA: TonB-dependent receptor, partial [Saprospiraceae bacterium]|nr:TonB-dependent receptor [Saprospiraceae bacterium]
FSDIGKHTDHFDTSAIWRMRSQTLSDMLSEQTPLYIRSYGNGTLATLGIRGGSASHTQIVWNGIPIRNPMIGLVDLALIPSWLMDDASIHYGGHGSAFGSGAVGGLISIANEPISQADHLEAHVMVGSWEQRIVELKLNYGFKSFRFSTRFSSQFAENNYRYIPLEGLAAKYQVHHRLKDNGVLQEMSWKLNQRQSLTGRVWYQNADRQIPPTSVQTTSQSAQQDEDWRATIEWMYKGEKVKWQLKAAWLDERIDFQDSLILLYTQNRFKTWLAEAQTAFNICSNINFVGGVYAETVKATSSNYPDGKSRKQYAAFVTTRWSLDDWTLRFQMREELTDQHWSPALLDFSAEWSGIKHLVCKASASRNYRIPTLNDLYWNPGGNADLDPEKGWTLESGLQYKSGQRQHQVTTSITAYTRKIDQWIMWLPPIKDMRNYWSPVNIAEVNSRGLEIRSIYRLVDQAWTIALQAGLDFTWSTFGTDIPDFQIQSGDQLFYVPVENVSGQVKCAFHEWSAYYRHYWYGDSPGINEKVHGANIGAAGIGYTIERPKWQVDILFHSDNIWDVPYRLIERRPMPGRSYNLGLHVRL